MPTIEFMLEDLRNLLGKNIKIEDLRERGILFAKGEIEEEEDGRIKVDIKDTNRPDLWSVEGIARELRGHYKIETGLPKFKIRKSGLVVGVDKKVEKVRPKTVCAVVKNLDFNENSIKQIIQLQEKVCQTFGRNRATAAIGIYDYDKIKGPIKYTTFKPKNLKFKPLGFKKEMTLEEILKKHPKGKKHGHLLEKHKEYPIFIDNGGNVLSMPPIINSDYTGKVGKKTKNVFIEVSGHRINTISIALNVIVSALKERGGKIYSVDVKYGKEEITTPDLSPNHGEMNLDKCKKILGLELSKREIKNLLKKSRCKGKTKDRKIKVKYPPYRKDIMDGRDLMEEVAISYGYDKIDSEEIKFHSRGKEERLEEFSNKIRELCIGFGLQEILTFTLTSKENLLEKMRSEDKKIAEISNPVSKNWSVFRNSLIPKGLEFLSKNKHVQYPQKIFEIGEITKINKKMETGTEDLRNLSTMITDNEIGYENMVSILDSIMKNLGIEYSLKKTKNKNFIEGRAAKISIGKKEVGYLGEIHPEVLENFNLEKPVVALEINLDEILKSGS